MQNKSTYFRSHFLVVAVEGKALFCMLQDFVVNGTEGVSNVNKRK